MTRLPTKARESMGWPVGLMSPSVTTRARTALPTWHGCRWQRERGRRCRLGCGRRWQRERGRRCRLGCGRRWQRGADVAAGGFGEDAGDGDDGGGFGRRRRRRRRWRRRMSRQRPRYPVRRDAHASLRGWARKFPRWPASDVSGGVDGQGAAAASTIRSASLVGVDGDLFSPTTTVVFCAG